MIKTLFWLSLGLVVYTYAGYPLLVGWLARVLRRPARKQALKTPYSVVIAAYNEEANLRRKIESLAGGSMATAMAEIWIGSDGSTDGMAGLEPELQAILLQHGLPDCRLHLVHHATRRGKPAVLNDLVPMCKSEIIVLTDARQEVEKEAVANLLANFSDPAIQVVSGELVFRRLDGDTSDARGAGAYWAYEKFIRRSEAAWGSVPGATGAFYAIRKDRFRPIPADTLLDDVLIPMQALEAGGRCTFEDSAVVYDRPTQDVKAEAIRKRRTLGGNLQLILRNPRWIVPGGHPAWFQFLSHKALRIFCPYLMLLLGLCNIHLVAQGAGWLYQLSLGSLVLTAGMAFAGWCLGPRAPFVLRLPALFFSLNWVAVLGCLDILFRRHRVTWARSSGG
jgi:biofilm PGA synthesis N-glycosyltransferase PgaC